MSLCTSKHLPATLSIVFVDMGLSFFSSSGSIKLFFNNGITVAILNQCGTLDELNDSCNYWQQNMKTLFKHVSWDWVEATRFGGR